MSKRYRNKKIRFTNLEKDFLDEASDTNVTGMKQFLKQNFEPEEMNQLQTKLQNLCKSRKRNHISMGTYYNLKKASCIDQPKCVRNPGYSLNLLSGRCNRASICKNGKPKMLHGLCPTFCKYGFTANGNCKRRAKNSCKYGSIKGYQDNITRCRNKTNIAKSFGLTRKEIRDFHPTNGIDKADKLNEFQDYATQLYPDREAFPSQTAAERRELNQNRQRQYINKKKDRQKRIKKIRKNLTAFRRQLDELRDNPPDGMRENIRQHRMNTIRGRIFGGEQDIRDLEQEAQDSIDDERLPSIFLYRRQQLIDLEPGHKLPSAEVFKCRICELVTNIDQYTINCTNPDNRFIHYYHKACLFKRYIGNIASGRPRGQTYDVDLMTPQTFCCDMDRTTYVDHLGADQGGHNWTAYPREEIENRIEHYRRGFLMDFLAYFNFLMELEGKNTRRRVYDYLYGTIYDADANAFVESYLDNLPNVIDQRQPYERLNPETMNPTSDLFEIPSNYNL